MLSGKIVWWLTYCFFLQILLLDGLLETRGKHSSQCSCLGRKKRTVKLQEIFYCSTMVVWPCSINTKTRITVQMLQGECNFYIRFAFLHFITVIQTWWKICTFPNNSAWQAELFGIMQIFHQVWITVINRLCRKSAATQFHRHCRKSARTGACMAARTRTFGQVTAYVWANWIKYSGHRSSRGCKFDKRQTYMVAASPVHFSQSNIILLPAGTNPMLARGKISIWVVLVAYAN